MLYQSNRMHDAVVSKLIATSRGSPCDSMASCTICIRKQLSVIIQELVIDVAVVTRSRHADRSCARHFAGAKPRFRGRSRFRWFYARIVWAAPPQNVLPHKKILVPEIVACYVPNPVYCSLPLLSLLGVFQLSFTWSSRSSCY